MKIEHGPNDFYQIYGPPSKVVFWIKYDVPDTYRFWDGEETYGKAAWYLHHKYLLDVIRLAYTCVPHVDYSALSIEEQIRIAQAKQTWKTSPYEGPFLKKETLETAYAVLHLLPTAPLAIVEAVWRKLAQLHHPDQGGDAELFKKYNEAYRKIKGRV